MARRGGRGGGGGDKNAETSAAVPAAAAPRPLRCLFAASGAAVLCAALVGSASTYGALAVGGAGVTPALYSYEVVAEYPHDPDAFTQGLVWSAGDGALWESTGLYGESELRRVRLEDGSVDRRARLEPSDFGEGLAEHNGSLLQLTWRSPKGLEYDAATLALKRTFRTPLKDGWGLTNSADGATLVATDSGATLYWLDPSDLRVVKSSTVTDGGAAVLWLNELELIDGEIWANIWQTDCIARIDPDTATVTGWVLMHGLKERAKAAGVRQRKQMDVLNGIAWDAERRRLFVTGKLWPRLFEVRVTRNEGATEADVALARQRCIVKRPTMRG